MDGSTARAKGLRSGWPVRAEGPGSPPHGARWKPEAHRPLRTADFQAQGPGLRPGFPAREEEASAHPCGPLSTWTSAVKTSVFTDPRVPDLRCPGPRQAPPMEIWGHWLVSTQRTHPRTTGKPGGAVGADSCPSGRKCLQQETPTRPEGPVPVGEGLETPLGAPRTLPGTCSARGHRCPGPPHRTGWPGA